MYINLNENRRANQKWTYIGHKIQNEDKQQHKKLRKDDQHGRHQK